MTFYCVFQTQVGKLYLKSQNNFLVQISWRKPADFVSSPNKLLDETQKQLQAYFNGKLQIFDLPLLLKGTSFQEKVWSILASIPYAQTVSYKDICDQLGSRAYQAVGSANGANPIPIIIPCHRVINASGKLGGYVAGLDIKKRLIEHERAGRQADDLYLI